MLGLGWTEMLVIGIVALIVIGPKDLPVVMNRIGKVAGQIRRMGSEFQREINKSTGLDEVRNLRNSITAPLKKTTDEIRREFNAMTPTGIQPSGVIKPTDPKVESVVDAIKTQAGMTEPKAEPKAEPKTADQVAAEAGFKPAGPAPVASKATVPATRKAPVKAARAAPSKPVTTADLAPLDPVPAPAEYVPVDVTERGKRKTPKVVAAKPVPALPTEPADSPATKTPRARAPRKTATAKAGSE